MAFIDDYFFWGGVVGELLERSYDPTLVILSYLVATFASYTSLKLVASMRAAFARGSGEYHLWLAAASIALGGGIFSMHFVAMEAFSLPVAIMYDLGTTLLSLVVAVLVSSFALFQIRAEQLSWARVCAGAALMGLGVAAMHYTGMAAVFTNATLRYHGPLYILSIFIAVTVALVALLLLRFVPEVQTRYAQSLHIGTASIMGMAVAGMHYTGMASSHFFVGGSCGLSVGPLDILIGRGQMAVQIAVVTVLIITVGLIASLISERDLLERQRLIVDLEEANAELRQSQAQLVQAGRLSALGQLGAGIAHELNQPLTGIIGFGSVVRKRLEVEQHPLAPQMKTILA